MKDYDKPFLKKLLHQDADAFSVIYDELVDQFYRYIKSHYTLEESEIHDILWDIFVKIRQALPRLDIQASLSWFLWTIAKNHIKDHFKRHTDVPFSHLNTPQDEGSNSAWEDWLQSSDNILSSIQTSFTHEVIRSCIWQLEDTYKNPILLKYVEEY